MWIELVRDCALRTRLLSNAVARLGQYDELGPEARQALTEVKKLDILFRAAADALLRYASGSARGAGQDHFGFAFWPSLNHDAVTSFGWSHSFGCWLPLLRL